MADFFPFPAGTYRRHISFPSAEAFSFGDVLHRGELSLYGCSRSCHVAARCRFPSPPACAGAGGGSERSPPRPSRTSLRCLGLCSELRGRGRGRARTHARTPPSVAALPAFLPSFLPSCPRPPARLRSAHMAMSICVCFSGNEFVELAQGRADCTHLTTPCPQIDISRISFMFRERSLPQFARISLGRTVSPTEARPLDERAFKSSIFSARTCAEKSFLGCHCGTVAAKMECRKISLPRRRTHACRVTSFARHLPKIPVHVRFAASGSSSRLLRAEPTVRPAGRTSGRLCVLISGTVINREIESSAVLGCHYCGAGLPESTYGCTERGKDLAAAAPAPVSQGKSAAWIPSCHRRRKSPP